MSALVSNVIGAIYVTMPMTYTTKMAYAFCVVNIQKGEGDYEHNIVYKEIRNKWQRYP